ncbi:two-component system sensor histidine kinase NtrB [Aliiroseovarius sp. YM-037]|uniref:two-component system sensor histidine kinase NtrB n=1 Tax=Aliiroseovarius sp. YM-037 TaxID=3341728 RepID=UPI003A80A764
MSVDDPTLWASLPSSALIVKADGIITDSNPAAESFLNLSRKALIGGTITDKLICDASLPDAIARVIAGHSGIFINDAVLGSVARAGILCQIQIAPLGDSVEYLLILITPREISGQLGHPRGGSSVVKSAIGMAELLAHEIKNPLAGITGAAQLLSMGLSGEDREMTDLIVAETRRILKLLDQVEQFGNLLPPSRRRVNLHDVLDQARRSAQVGFASNVAIKDDYDPSLPDTFADPDQLLQVFHNLIRNAAAALAGVDDATITLRTFYDHSMHLRRPDGSAFGLPLQVEVIDNGNGLPPEIADHVFEPFVSGHENGTGLGLALVSKIVADHEGWITANSAPGRTVFRLSLPLAKETEGAD